MESGAIADTEAARAEAIAKHFVAVSTALDKVAEFGIDPANAFGFWDWVEWTLLGRLGRRHGDHAVAIGPDNFADFLAGFHAIDEHFATTPWKQNVPALMGLLNIWYTDFFNCRSHAVLPYAHLPVPGLPAAAHDGIQQQDDVARSPPPPAKYS